MVTLSRHSASTAAASTRDAGEERTNPAHEALPATVLAAAAARGFAAGNGFLTGQIVDRSA